MQIPKWLIATAGLLFVVLIAAVAFFIGRQTAQPPQAPIAVSALAPEPASVRDPAPAPEPKPPVAEASGSASDLIGSAVEAAVISEFPMLSPVSRLARGMV